MLNSPVRGLLRPKTMQIGKGGFRRKKALQPQSYTPSVVFGSDLVTYYGNSVDELFAQHRKAWEDSPELVTTLSGLTPSNPEWAFSGGAWVLTNSTTNDRTLLFSGLVVGKLYYLEATVSALSSGSLTFRHPNSSATVGDTLSAPGRLRASFTAASTAVFLRNSAAGQNAVVTGVSIREIDPTKLRLYQDSAGTTPVTAVEQFVGLVLDQSQGLELGDPTINGSFSDSTGWAGVGSGGWSIVAGRLVRSAGQSSTTQVNRIDGVSFKANKWYSVSVSVIAVTGEIRVQSNTSQQIFVSGITTRGVKTVIFYSASAVNVQVLAIGTATCEIDDLVIRELPGNHLSQPTATARPRLIQRTDLPGNPFVLRPDGTDDRLVTGTIDLAGVPGLHMVGAAVRTAGTARAVLVGFGDPLTNTNGVNLEFATDGATADAGIRARSGGAAGIAATPAALLTPMVLSGWWDASDKLGRSRINGGATQTAAGASGDTGLGSGAISVGARPAGTNGFAGDIFALPMIVKRTLTPDERAAAEKAFSKSIGVLQ